MALSINLTRILELDRKENSRLADRAFGALIALITVLFVSSLLLIPTSSAMIPGFGLLVIGEGDLLYQLFSARRGVGMPSPGSTA